EEGRQEEIKEGRQDVSQESCEESCEENCEEGCQEVREEGCGAEEGGSQESSESRSQEECGEEEGGASPEAGSPDGSSGSCSGAGVRHELGHSLDGRRQLLSGGRGRLVLVSVSIGHPWRQGRSGDAAAFLHPRLQRPSASGAIRADR